MKGPDLQTFGIQGFRLGETRGDVFAFLAANYV